MPEHVTREKRALYDHESPTLPAGGPPTTGASTRASRASRGRRFAARPRGPAAQPPPPGGGLGRRSRRSSRRSQPEPEEPRRGRRVRQAQTEEFVAEASTRPSPRSCTEGRRTIRINGRPGEVSEIAPFTSTARRRRPPRTVEERLAGDPTRIIAWAFRSGCC